MTDILAPDLSYRLAVLALSWLVLSVIVGLILGPLMGAGSGDEGGDYAPGQIATTPHARILHCLTTTPREPHDAYRCQHQTCPGD